MLFFSRAGTAKSQLLRCVLDALEAQGEKTFFAEASKEDRSSRYLGGIDKKIFLETGREVRNTAGHLPEANVAMIDELFDLPDDTLRDVMKVMLGNNLRMFAAANYMRKNEVTEAVLDRFGFKVLTIGEMDPLDHFAIDMVNESNRDHSPVVLPDMKDLEEVTGILRNQNPEYRIRISPKILFLKAQALQQFVEEMRRTDRDYYLSPRRRTMMVQLLRLSALLAGRDEVNKEDLRHLQYGASLIGQTDEARKLAESVQKTLQLFSGAEKELQLLSFAEENIGVILNPEQTAQAQKLCDEVPQTGRSFRLPWNRPGIWEELSQCLERMEVSHASINEWRNSLLQKLKEANNGS